MAYLNQWYVHFVSRHGNYLRTVPVSDAYTYEKDALQDARNRNRYKLLTGRYIVLPNKHKNVF